MEKLMEQYIKPSVKILVMPDIMQGFYDTSTPEEQLSKPDVETSDTFNDDEEWGLGNMSIWND